MTDKPHTIYVRPAEVTPEIRTTIETQLQEAHDVLIAWVAHRIECSNNWATASRGYDLCDTEVQLLEQLNAKPALRESVLLLAIHLLTKAMNNG